MLNSGRLSLRRSWPSSKSGVLDKSTLPGGGYNMQAMFANTGSSGKGQDGNKDHMAVVAAAMQAAKPANDGATTRSQAVTTATIRGILTGIK